MYDASGNDQPDAVVAVENRPRHEPAAHANNR